MKPEKLSDALPHIGDDLINAAGTARKKPRRPWIRWSIAAACFILAVIVATSGLSTILPKPTTPSTSSAPTANEPPLVNEHPTTNGYIALANYPKMAQYPSDLNDREAYEAWQKDRRARQNNSINYSGSFSSFFKKTALEFIGDTDTENRVYSPLNVYTALSMLAETTDSNSRKQLLKLLGVNSIKELRTKTTAMWNANYCDDGMTTSILANSLWLNKELGYNQTTADRLSNEYYASTFRGEMGSDEYNAQLQNWLNEQTGGLLKEQAGNIKMSPETLLVLASTVYFKASWENRFSSHATKQDVFHSPNGDMNCDFMNYRRTMPYAVGKNFSAVKLSFAQGGAMRLILPDEDTSARQLLNDTEAVDYILSGDKWKNIENALVNLSMPKFDVCSELNLGESLHALGVTDIFNDAVADFSPIINGEVKAAVSDITHAARVQVDEEGCTAAAFTTIIKATGSRPSNDEIDFTLDRPFIFVIDGLDGNPLFIGIVNQPISVAN